MSDEIQREREIAEAFCARNLKECCTELLGWYETTVLPSGKVRELQALFSYAGPRALAVAEDEIKRQALKTIARS